MINKTPIYIFAILLLTGTTEAYTWTPQITDYLENLYCMNCTLDNPSFLNYSFPNGSGNFSGNHNDLINLTWSTAGHIMNSDVHFVSDGIKLYNQDNKTDIYLGNTASRFEMQPYGYNYGFFSVETQESPSVVYLQMYSTNDDSEDTSSILTRPQDITITTANLIIGNINISENNISNINKINGNDVGFNSTYSSYGSSISTLQNNDTTHTNQIISLQANDSNPALIYNWTDNTSNITLNKTYWNNNNYAWYLSSSLVAAGAADCVVTLMIDGHAVGRAVSNAYYNMWLGIVPINYIVLPNSSYRFEKDGANPSCYHGIETTYLHRLT